MSGNSEGPRSTSPPGGDADTSLVASRYEIQELLGRGSMGAVYCARDVVLDRAVALKLFPAEAADPQQAVRYEQEARLLARLSHPGLVTVYDAGIDATVAEAPRPYLVMELVRGPTLADRLHRGALPPDEVGTLGVELASALAHIHRREVVHRDVKPANILLRESEDGVSPPHATLTDFGIARLVDGTRITMTGFTLGTANYLSPEQLNGGEVRPPSDIYSLGLVLLECLTGEIVYPGHGVEAALPRLKGAPTIPDTVPPEWSQLVGAMTDLDPDRRPAADEVISLLGRLGTSGSVAGEAPPATPAAPEEPTIATYRVVEPAPRVPDVDQTRVLAVPAAAQAGQPKRSLLRPTVLIGLVVAAIVLIFLISYAASDDSGSPAPTSPPYPSVSGPIGEHLRQLQQDVAP